MANRYHLLVLANSNKPGGRCLAGRFFEMVDGKKKLGAWCRPVFHYGDHDSIPLAACEKVFPLDEISIELKGHNPADGQPENWEWAAGTDIVLVKSYNNKQGVMNKFLDKPDDLWIDADSGRPDEVRITVPIEDSLKLIQPKNLEFDLSKNGDKNLLKASFEYNNHYYDSIPVTDPVIKKRVFSKQYPENGHVKKRLNNNDSYWLTVSISLPYKSSPNNSRFKFVAAVIDHSGYIQRSYR